MMVPEEEASSARFAPETIGKASDEPLPLLERRVDHHSNSKSTSKLSIPETTTSFEAKFVMSWIFEMGCGFVIILSVLTVAWDVDGLEAPFFLQFMESAVTSFFLMEWLVRFKVLGLNWLMDPMVMFDTFIVWVPGVVAVWAFQPLVQHDATDFLKVLCTVRMMRLLRIVFFFKHFKAFQDIFQLVRGLLSSGGTLLSALGLIAFTLYVFAIIAIDLIGHQDFTGASEDVLEAQAGFQEIFPTMLTLIRFMHADDSQPILDLLTKKLPWIWVFTWLFTAISAFVFLNLVTAIIVQQALEMASGDESERVQQLQRQRERDMQDLEETFRRLDEDASGQVSLEEFMQAFKIKEIRAKMTLLNLKEQEMVDLFRHLDTAGEGELSLDEFTSGMSQLKGDATNKDMVFLEKSIEKLGQKLQKLEGPQSSQLTRRTVTNPGTCLKLRGKLNQIAINVQQRLTQAEKEVEDVAERMYNLALECMTLSPGSTSKVPVRAKAAGAYTGPPGSFAMSRGSLLTQGESSVVGPPTSTFRAPSTSMLSESTDDSSEGLRGGAGRSTSAVDGTYVVETPPVMTFLSESSQ